MTFHGELPLTRDRLVDAYFQVGKPRESWKVGAEFERHLLVVDGRPLPYFGTPGVAWLLSRLEEDGWTPVREGAHTIALLRGATSVTLEPGGQLELSGAPFLSVSEVAAEALDFARRVHELLGPYDVTQAALGFTPFAAVPDIGWVPKGRYVVMREHLAETGDLAHHMMKGTAAVQASYDFSDEADCARKVQLATRLGPLTTAIFANSPYVEGKAVPFASWRGHVWTRTDPARTGFPAAANEFGFERWVDYLLDVPMMFYKIDGVWTPARGRTFRDWMARGQDGVLPTWKDWELHTTSVFPEVRVKHAIEVRGADCVPFPLAMGFVAMFEGLFYGAGVAEAAADLAERFTATGDKASRFAAATAHGLEGSVGGRRLSEWAMELVDLAGRGLDQWAPGDRHWLTPVEHLIEGGRSPGPLLREAAGDRPSPSELASHTGWLPPAL